MAAVTQNKLTPVFVICALVIVGYVIWGHYGGQTSPVKSGAPLTAVPTAPGDSEPAAKGGMFGVGALTAVPHRADADSPSETLKTVTASNNDLRDKVQGVIEANEALKRENAKLQNNQAAIVAQVTERVLAEQRLSTERAALAADRSEATAIDQSSRIKQSPGVVSGIVDAATGGYESMTKSLAPAGLKGMPPGLGYDATSSNRLGGASAPGTVSGYVKYLPAGYKEAKAADGSVGIVNAHGEPVGMGLAATRKGLDRPVAAEGDATTSAPKKTTKPYYTIPENATMTRATLMTALVGRVPIDGKVQDPMQFKLLIGRENLAANGHLVPDSVAGIVISGVAIGDMALSCSEGLVQSLTFVFDDGSIKTVSMKKEGASLGFGAAAGGLNTGAAPSISQSNKLAWISDEYGNPCINGKFVTNAPAYLTDIVGLKTLSIAAQASALAQTTTSVDPLGSTTSVTGNKNTYILGQAAGAGVNEVSNWIMRRLNNSFDAVVTPAGGRVVVHFEQEVTIDKGPDSRKLEYGNYQAAAHAAGQQLD